MKKLMIAALLVATIGTSAFAANTDKVSYKVTNSFEAKFEGATNVQWTKTENFTKVTFDLNDQQIEAFYSNEGESLGYSRKVEMKQLPVNAITKIKKMYPSYSTKEVIEFDRDGEKTFYVSLTQGNKSQILEVTPYGSVNTYKN